ncbi:MAG: BppU family phage baseplate upper protein [Atopobiaceae bacterium]
MTRYFEYGDTEVNYLKAHDKKLAAAIDAVGHVYRQMDEGSLFSGIVHHIIGQQVSSAAQATVWARLQAQLGEVTWSAGDSWESGALTASPQDARGRGMLLAVTRNGMALDLTGAKLYLVWRHRQTHARGCAQMEAVDAAAGRFRVFWPAAMASDEGSCECEVVLSWGDRTIASPSFDVAVSTSLVGAVSTGDGFTLFVEAIKRYEDAATEVASRKLV